MQLVIPSSIALGACILLAGSSPASDQALQRPLRLPHDAASDGQFVRQALKIADIIPDVLDDFEPSIVFTPYYPSKNKTVDLGNRIKPKAVASSPDIYASGTVKPNITYTLVLTDPDATSRAHPIKAQMCHWIVTNITAPSPDAGQGEGFDLGHVSSLAGQNGALELEPYFPPSPPPKTGYHRYVFVVLASKSGLEIPKMPKKRPHWGYGKVGAGVREWAFDNKLSVIGANFFYAENKKQ